MHRLKLVLGTRNLSSWSLRPWLLLKQLRLPFEEVVIPLRQADTAERIRPWSPSGKVPVLIADGVTIWDSLAIAEFLAEGHPALWPADRAARALARSACAEMHSGFSALRTFLPMDFTGRFPPPGRFLDAVARDIERVLALWADCRHAASDNGPFLFGSSFTIPDAMFAPVCSRFTTYAVPVGVSAQTYVGHMMNLPAMREWGRLAQAEIEGRPAVTAPPEPERAPAPSAPAPSPPPAPAVRVQSPVPEPEPPARGPRPIPPTIMVKPIGDGTRRRR